MNYIEPNLLLGAAAALLIAALVTISLMLRSMGARKREQQQQLEQLSQAHQFELANQQSEIAAVEQQLTELQNKLLELSNQSASLQAQKEALQQSNQELKIANQELSQLHQVVSQLKQENSVLQAQMESEKLHWQERIQELNQNKEHLKQEFERLAQQIFEHKSNQFIQQSQQNMQQLLAPFREQVGEFRKRVDDIFAKETEQRSSLENELRNLQKLNQKMTEDAQQLTKALKGDKKMQGNWGEVILERLLELSGLEKGREYETQTSFTLANGKRLQPDVLIRMPDKKTMIVDSKVSLVAYEAYTRAEEDSDRAMFLKQHIKALQNQVENLSGKDYQGIPELETLDFVLMFIPIEPAYLVALEHEPQLFEQAFAKRVILVSPSNLLSTLRVVHNLWRHERQNQNAEEIARQAGDMLDKFVGFTDALDDIGKKLEHAQEAYMTAKSRLATGRGNLINRAQKLKSLGAKPTKQLPESV